MKHCPECNRTYADPTLSFCLQDGAPLIFGAAAEEPATAILTSVADEQATKAFDQDPATGQPSLERSTLPASKKNSIVGGVIGIILVTILGVGSYFYFGRASSKQIDSIAVMPFVNESGNPDIEYLSDGMTESLINTLTNLPNLSVKARNSVFRYKGAEIDEKKVGQELSVQAILLGRITQRGDNITLFLSLIDVRTGTSLWGEQYERRMQDLAVLQKDITRDVSQKLRSRLSNADTTQLTRNYTDNAEAYELYLKGRFLWAKRNPEAIRKAIEYFDQAIEKDRGFALAYAGLADAYVVPGNRMVPRDAMPKAKAAATRALEIDPTLAEAHASLGRVLQVYDWNWSEAEREFKRAIELNPSYPVAHQWYGGYLERVGKLNEAIAERKLALELDPLSVITNFELGQTYFFSRDYDQAIRQLEKTLELDPGFPAALQYLPAVYAQKGMYDEAIRQIEKSPESAQIASTGVPAHVYAMAGRTREARVMLDELKSLREKGPEYISATGIALAHLALGEKEEALTWLEKGYEDRAFQMQFLKVDPRLDSLRADPRFNDLVRRVGFPQ